MINNEIKLLINEVIDLYSTPPITQDIIDKGCEQLSEAISLLKVLFIPFIVNKLVQSLKRLSPLVIVSSRCITLVIAEAKFEGIGLPVPKVTAFSVIILKIPLLV